MACFQTETERQRETDRKRQRDRDREAQRDTDRQRDRETESLFYINQTSHLYSLILYLLWQKVS